MWAMIVVGAKRELQVVYCEDKDKDKLSLKRVQYDDWTFIFKPLLNDIPVVNLSAFTFKCAIYRGATSVVEVSSVAPTADGDVIISPPYVTIDFLRAATLTIAPGSYTLQLQSIDADNKQKTWTPTGIPLIILPGVLL